MFIVCFCVCILFAVIGNIMGEKKEMGGGAGAILGFFLCIIGLIIIAASKDREDEPEYTYTPTEPVSKVDELQKWFALKQAGAISETEFEEKKRKLI